MDIEKEGLGRTDSSSGHSPHDEDGKMGVHPGGLGPEDTIRLPPDPDDGLSEEERRRIVSFDHSAAWARCVLTLTRGPAPATEA